MTGREFEDAFSTGPGISDHWVRALGPSLPFDTPAAERYERGGILGEGGMGRVWVAHDHRLGREVALKVARRDDPDPLLEARMAREAWITAQLDHPAIVPVHDAGRGPTGEPYYTMRLVPGRSLAEALAKGGGLELVPALLDACRAIAHAHARAIVHRDIKPANVMLGELGEVQVVDWGLATRVDPEAPVMLPPGAEDFSRTNELAGTARWMSPERRAGARATTQGDVWSLGRILWELIDDESPAELLSIAERACADDPRERYPDAREMADDLNSFLLGQTVAAYRYSAWEQLARLIRAWRAPLSVGAVALAVLAVVVVQGLERLAQEQAELLAAQAELLAAQASTRAALAEAYLEQAQAAAARDDRPVAERAAVQALELAESPRARGVLARFGDSARPRFIAEAEGPRCAKAQIAAGGMLICSTDEHIEGWSLAEAVTRWRIELDAPRWSLSWDGERVAVSDSSGQFGLLEVETGRGPVEQVDRNRLSTSMPVPARDWVASHTDDAVELHRLSPRADLRVSLPDTVLALTSLPTGALLVVTHAGELFTFGPGTGWVLRRLGALPKGISPWRTVVERGGRGLVFNDFDNRLYRYDLDTFELKEAPELLRTELREMSLAPDGDAVVLVDQRGEVRVWDLTTNLFRAQLPGGGVIGAGFVGVDRISTIGEGVREWQLPRDWRPARFEAGAGLSSASLSPDGELLALGLGDGRALIVDRVTGLVLWEHDYGDKAVKDVAWGPEGDELFIAEVATGHLRRIVRTQGGWWDERGAQRGGIREVAVMHDGQLLAASYAQWFGRWADEEGTITQVDMAYIPKSIALDPERRRFALGTTTGELLFGDGTRLDQTARLRSPGLRALALGPRSELLALASGEGIELRALPELELVETLAVSGALVEALAISPDGRWLAAGDLGGELRLWSLPDTRLVAQAEAHRGQISKLEFSADSQLLVSASWDERARIWAMGSLEAPWQELRDQIDDVWPAPAPVALEEDAD